MAKIVIKLPYLLARERFLQGLRNCFYLEWVNDTTKLVFVFKLLAQEVH